jgi:hypothetical protein
MRGRGGVDTRWLIRNEPYLFMKASSRDEASHDAAQPPAGGGPMTDKSACTLTHERHDWGLSTRDSALVTVTGQAPEEAVAVSAGDKLTRNLPLSISDPAIGRSDPACDRHAGLLTPTKSMNTN